MIIFTSHDVEPVTDKPHLTYQYGLSGLNPWKIWFYQDTDMSADKLMYLSGSTPERAYNQYLSFIRMNHGVVE